MQLSRGRKTIIIIAVFSAWFCWGILFAIQPSFYPMEAESKGANPAEYGMVFGMASLAGIIFAPFYSWAGKILQPKVLGYLGVALQSLATISFGFLGYVNNMYLFLVLSYLLRFLEGTGSGASSAGLKSVIMKLFPGGESTLFALTGGAYSIGFTIGPAVGAMLFTTGGFALPFFVTGGALIITTIFLVMVIPNIDHSESNVLNNNIENKGKNKDDKKPDLKFWESFKHPTISLPCAEIFTCYFLLNLVMVDLEPHMIKSKDINASHDQVAHTFILYGLVYAIGTVLPGYICDKMEIPAYISLFGNIVLCIAYTFMGPAPCLRIKTNYSLVTSMVALQSVGDAIMFVVSFSRVIKASKNLGYSDSVHTFIVLSSVTYASWSLANFLGSFVMGIAVTYLGFARTAQYCVIFFALLGFFDALEIIQHEKAKRLLSQINPSWS